jgi:hypothetical protein
MKKDSHDYVRKRPIQKIKDLYPVGKGRGVPIAIFAEKSNLYFHKELLIDKT